MKVLYYTRPCFLDLALSHAAELAKLVELHIVLELAPENWQSSIFDLSRQMLTQGVHDGTAFFRREYPQIFDIYLSHCESITLIVHNCPKSIHPKTWRVALQAMRFCRKIDPDIIHFDEPSLRTAWGIWHLRDIPLLFSIHDPVAHSGEENWRKTLSRTLSFPFADRFLLHSTNTRQSFIGNYPKIAAEKVMKTSLGIYDIYRQWIKDPIRDNGRTILFFGRLSPYKGVDILLQAAPLIAEKIKNVCIVVAGKPIDGYSLPALPDLDNGGRFEVIDTYIDNPVLADLFQRATAVTCPYIDATQSGVVLTAYAFNKPVVASNTGGLPEYVWHGKTGLLVEPGDHIHLAEALIDILDNTFMRTTMENYIRQIANSELGWDRIAEQTFNIYSDIPAAGSGKQAHSPQR